ncbi:hypothetical protein O2W14_13605 [Modestobacter sp. VKM Ac-2986]|uniref:hypothetical protein n=1 Tax=Modestobacter sp. VKM Ac-2986 TaxID=3004140 RepID=UPI0022AB6CD3|nr:hypothetical protein [Modestobacter sp. VKM Ac-2986]MCZ2829874.1 hypothetical protein [Modestobacter sp. VKM Ac-2986]
MAQPVWDNSVVSVPDRRDVVRTVGSRSAEALQSLGRPCSCGHGKRTHEHYRAGSDCALCGCGSYRGPLRRMLHLG